MKTQVNAEPVIRKKIRIGRKEKCLVPVIVDQDPALNFESDSWIMKIFLLPLRLFLNVIPAKLGGKIFTAFSGPQGDTRIVHRWAATYKAIEVPYTYPKRRSQGKTNFSDDFWENFLLSARGVRNRLKIVKRELAEVIGDVQKRKGSVHLFSLGSGSARGVIEVLAQLKNNHSIHVKCIDSSRKALQFSQELASEYGVVLDTFRDFAQNIRKYCEDSTPDIVEMVGLFDYYEGEQAINLIQECYQSLSSGGWFIVSNATPNIEVPFFTKGMNWSLIYRTPTELSEILLRAGFVIKKIIQEPLRVHTIIVAQKVV